MDKSLQAIVDAHERKVKDQDLSDAAAGLKPKSGRGTFSLQQLLPPELADAAAEQQRFIEAQRVLAAKAEWLYRQPPRNIKLHQEARTGFHRWWERHQEESLAPTTNPVVSAMLGKTSAHALRLAGMLHLVRSNDDHVSAEMMELAMVIVDQLITETKAFHDAPP